MTEGNDFVDRLNARDFAALFEGALEALRVYREEIDSLNVFPVPDGDTGTNMLLTMQAVVDEVGKMDGVDMPSLWRAAARASLMGARGNSGVVLSQIFKGMAEVFQERETADIAVMAEALNRGAEVAYRAVMKPVEGTILTVVREAAEEGERRADDCRDLREWLRAVLQRASQSLSHTPELLPVLKEAGVVDAGGRGLVAILEGMLARLEGVTVGEGGAEETRSQAAVAVVEETEDYQYEAQFILACGDSDAEDFREKLGELGGSVLVVGGDGVYRVHVHTDRLGRVIEEASRIGRLSDVEITDLRRQVEKAGTAMEEAVRDDGRVGLVAVAAGDGIKEVLRSLGVDVIVDGGQSMNPSTAEMLDAVDGLSRRKVIILPNNKNIVPAAEQVGGLTSKEVSVIPSRSIAEGFAALVAFDRREGMEVNREKMLRAMERVRTGAVTAAVREGKFTGGRIEPGDYIGIYHGEIVASGKDAASVARTLLEKMLEDGGELVTVVLGEGADRGTGRSIEEFLADRGMEVEVIEGGQPVYQYIFGVE